MNRKIIVLLLIAILFASVDSFAQGIFNNNKDTSKKDNSRPPIFKGRDDPTPPGENEDPIGSGLLILTTLAGGYALVKNRKSNKK